MKFSDHGRWRGRLTQKPLPDQDPAIEALSPDVRERLARIWQSRAAMERRVGDSFAVIRGALERRNAPRPWIDLAARAVDDELRHAELSRLVASRFAARELADPERLVLDVPKHEGASPELRDSLYVVGQCVLNETTASAFLEACYQHAEGELAKAALRELLSDEIEHGRLGWSYLASLDAEARRAIGPWLLPMAYLNLRIWKDESPYDPRHVPALTQHGAPPAPITHRAMVDALASLILPGLAELRMPTKALEAWLAAGAFTDRAPKEFAQIHG